MCKKCDLMVELLQKTVDGKSYVESEFPNGMPRLITPKDEDA